MLNKQELYQLYAEADFGMVASMSNISLVPYEMLAAGLPVIEFEDGTFTEFFPEDCAILTSLSGRELYQRLKAAMADPEGMKRRQERAKEQLDLVSWEKTGAQFAEIIRGRCL